MTLYGKLLYYYFIIMYNCIVKYKVLNLLTPIISEKVC